MPGRILAFLLLIKDVKNKKSKNATSSILLLKQWNVGEKAFTMGAALTHWIAAGRSLFRRLLCEYYAEQNVEFRLLLNADKGQRSWSPETIVCNISNFLYAQEGCAMQNSRQITAK